MVLEFKKNAETDRQGINIVTERLVLEPLGVEHLESAHEYASDLENTRYMVHLPNENIEETKEFLTGVEQEWKKENPISYEFAILLDGVHIGAVNIYVTDDRTSGELGWILNKKYWHQGYAIEAAKALMEFAVQRLGIKHFIAHCDGENAGSYKVMEKLGMQMTQRYHGRKNKSSDEEREELQYEVRI